MIIKRNIKGKKLKRPYEMSIEEVLKKDAMLFINNIPTFTKKQAFNKQAQIIVNSQNPEQMYSGYMEDLDCRLKEFDK